MGSNAQERDACKMIGSTILGVVTHAMLPLAWFVLAVFTVPKSHVIFNQLGAELPKLTIAAIKFSDFICRSWFLYLPILALMLAADGAIYYSLLRLPKRTAVYLWSGGILLTQGALTLLGVIALYLPVMRTMTSIES